MSQPSLIRWLTFFFSLRKSFLKLFPTVVIIFPVIKTKQDVAALQRGKHRKVVQCKATWLLASDRNPNMSGPETFMSRHGCSSEQDGEWGARSMVCRFSSGPAECKPWCFLILMLSSYLSRAGNVAYHLNSLAFVLLSKIQNLKQVLKQKKHFTRKSYHRKPQHMVT